MARVECVMGDPRSSLLQLCGKHRRVMRLAPGVAKAGQEENGRSVQGREEEILGQHLRTQEDSPGDALRGNGQLGSGKDGAAGIPHQSQRLLILKACKAVRGKALACQFQQQLLRNAEIWIAPEEGESRAIGKPTLRTVDLRLQI